MLTKMLTKIAGLP